MSIQFTETGCDSLPPARAKMERFPKREWMIETPLPRQGRRNSAWVVVVEFLIVAAPFVADFQHHVYFSKTPFLFLLGWISLRWRGLGWRDVGLARPANWRRTIVIGILCGIGIELLELFVTQPLLVKVTGKMPDLSDLGDMRGNWKLLLFLALTWTLAAFGEEMGFAFGLGHIDQGMTGQVENMIDGLLLGLIFLATGCNLWAAIITHGLTDTIDILLLYLGKYPGV
jgi:uncharacterized protein